MTELLTGVRWVNVALGLLGLVLCLLKASRYWSRYTPVARGFVMSLTLFCLATVWGTGEQLALGVPPGSRVLVTTIALANLLYALLRTWGHSYYVEFQPANRVR